MEKKKTLAPQDKKNKVSLAERFAKADKVDLLQHSVWWALIIGGALVFIYSLMMCTPIANLRSAIDFEDVKAIMSSSKGYNDTICLLGLFGIVLALLYKFTRTSIRKKFFISNFVYLGVTTLYIIVSSGVMFTFVAKFWAEFRNLNYDQINEWFAIILPELSPYPAYTFFFVIGFVIAAIYLIVGIIAGVLLGIKIYQRYFKPEVNNAASEEAVSEQETAKKLG